MSIPRESQAEILTVAPDTSVREAAEKMTGAEVGAVCVLDGEKLVGLLSERDVMKRVVLADKRPRDVKVSEVMKEAVSVDESVKVDDVLRRMTETGVRHMPLVDGDGKLRAMLTMRRLLDYRLSELELENQSLAAFLMADGIGG